MTKGHIHKLKRKNYRNGESIFFCVGETCKYKVNVDLSIGKKVECWRCGNPFVMNEYTKRLAKPHCSDCTKKKDVVIPDVVPTNNIKDHLRIREAIQRENNATNDSASALRSRLLSTIGESIQQADDSDNENEIEDSDDLL